MCVCVCASHLHNNTALPHTQSTPIDVLARRYIIYVCVCVQVGTNNIRVHAECFGRHNRRRRRIRRPTGPETRSPKS